LGDQHGKLRCQNTVCGRVQQEMARYAHLNDTASASVKIIAEKLGQWREGPTMIKTDNVRLEARHGNSHAF
jgi:hypothetical protein